eukprot:1347296-Amphidinium_carterae.1
MASSDLDHFVPHQLKSGENQFSDIVVSDLSSAVLWFPLVCWGNLPRDILLVIQGDDTKPCELRPLAFANVLHLKFWLRNTLRGVCSRFKPSGLRVFAFCAR